MLNRLIPHATNLLGSQPRWGLAVAVLMGTLVSLLPLQLAIGLGVVLFVVGALVLIMEQPLWGLAFTLLIAPLGAWEAQHPVLAAFPLPFGQLAWIGTCVIWLFYWLSQKRRTLPSFGIQRPLTLFLFITLLSLLGAESMSLGAKEVIKWLEILVAIWLVLDTRPSDNQTAVWALLFMIWLPAVAQGALGLAQFVQTDGPTSFLILDRFYRAYGTFQQPNPFGGFMALNGLLALGIVIGLASDWLGEYWGKISTHSEQSRAKRNISRYLMLGLALAVLGITAGGLIASWSRGAWLGFVAGGVVIAFFWPRQRVWGVALLVIGAVVGLGAWQAGLVPNSIVDRVTSSTEFELRPLRDIELSDTNYALLERLAFWRAAVGMTEQNLWLGVGFGNYDAAYGAFAPVTWPQSLGHAHNYYLNLAAEIGILGLIAYVVFWSAVVWQNIYFLGKTSGLHRAILLGLLGSWAALSVHHLVDKLYVNNMYIHIGVLLALQQVVVQTTEGHENGVAKEIIE